MIESQPHHIDGSTVAVIVTYGQRAALLRQTIENVTRCAELIHIIIVDNGSLQELDLDKVEFEGAITVVRNQYNLGSAGGFGRGIAAALLIKDAEFLVILDDDNLVEPNFLTKLVKCYRALRSGSDVALCALREDRPQYQLLLENGSAALPRPNAFLGFHIGDTLRRIVNRKAKKPTGKVENVRLRAIETGPYGGLFMTVEAAKVTGIPRADFILYGDDHEYTQRLGANNIDLYLTDLVKVTDGERSWNMSGSKESPWLASQGGGWRQYYAARNHVYLECAARPKAAIYQVNRFLFTLRLTLSCFFINRSFLRTRTLLTPFMKGVRDGIRGELGYRAQFPIPGAPPSDGLCIQNVDGLR